MRTQDQQSEYQHNKRGINNEWKDYFEQLTECRLTSLQNSNIVERNRQKASRETLEIENKTFKFKKKSLIGLKNRMDTAENQSQQVGRGIPQLKGIW